MVEEGKATLEYLLEELEGTDEGDMNQRMEDPDTPLRPTTVQSLLKLAEPQIRE